ncbi:MAG: hypothetical protein WAM75_15145, partial [Xanthobacteraceae bacterium]
RVGIEPLGDNDFYGQTYFVDPRGQLVGDAGRPAAAFAVGPAAVGRFAVARFAVVSVTASGLMQH